MTRQQVHLNSLFILLGIILFAPTGLFAASGTIEASHKYAWGNVAGYINFAPTNATITVTDSAVTGYAWSQNDGWINFQPTSGGVTNDGSGTLGGWAWDESRGWISFTGVVINQFGKFTGRATGSDGYAISFNCTYCDVVTSWRPIPIHMQSGGGGGSSSGGSSGSSNSQPAEPTDTPATQPPLNPALEPSEPPPGSGAGSYGITESLIGTSAQTGDIYYETNPVSTSTVFATTSHSSTAASSTSDVPTSTRPWWPWVAGGGALLLLLAFFVLRFLQEN